MKAFMLMILIIILGCSNNPVSQDDGQNHTSNGSSYTIVEGILDTVGRKKTFEKNKYRFCSVLLSYTRTFDDVTVVGYKNSNAFTVDFENGEIYFELFMPGQTKYKLILFE